MIRRADEEKRCKRCGWLYTDYGCTALECQKPFKAQYIYAPDVYAKDAELARLRATLALLAEHSGCAWTRAVAGREIASAAGDRVG